MRTSSGENVLSPPSSILCNYLITALPTFTSKSKLMTVLSQLTDKNLINDNEISSKLLEQLAQVASSQGRLDIEHISFITAQL